MNICDNSPFFIRNYSLLVLIRKPIISAVIINVYKNPQTQLTALLIAQGIYLLSNILYNPYKGKF